MSTHCSFVFAALLGVGLPALPATAPQDPPLLAILAEAGHPRHAEAAGAWKALSEAGRHALALEALLSEDPVLSLAGAVVIEPMRLDLRGLRRLDQVLLGDPLARFFPPPGLSNFQNFTPAFGSRSLPSIWEAIARRGVDFEPHKEINRSLFHRTLRHTELAALAPLLARLPSGWFRELLLLIEGQSDGVLGARQEALFTEIFRYAHRRIQAEEAGETVPEWGSLEPLPEHDGLPAAFLELWEGGVARGWLGYWATRLTPAEDDRSFLMNAILWARHPRDASSMISQLEAWAVRAVVRLARDDTDPFFLELLEMDRDLASLAAAEAAVAGRGSAWENLENKWPPAYWLADPAVAERRVLEALRRGESVEELDPCDRLRLAFDAGIEISTTALERIVAALREGGFPPWMELWFFAEVMPGMFTRADAERIVARWKGAAQGEAGAVERTGDRSHLAEDGQDSHGVNPRHLVLLEVHAPDLLLDLLRHLAREPDGEECDPMVKRIKAEDRARALMALARLGDAELLEDMLGLWIQSRQHGWFPIADVLGHVKDERVRAFLHERISAGDLEEEAAALRALAVYHGCPTEIARVIDPGSWWDFEQVEQREWARAKALLLAGEHVGALLLIVSSPGFKRSSALFHFAHEYGPALDRRILDWMSSRRTGNHDDYDGEYWLGTAALALAGDREADSEWRTFLDEGRTYLIDKISGTALLSLDGDPRLTRFWIERLDENCCARFSAFQAIEATFPTFPYDHMGPDGGRLRAGAERWFAAHAGTFVKSRLLGGWVPGPR